MSLMPQKRFEELLSQFKNAGPIMVIGDVGVDKYTYGDVCRISPEAPVPILEVSNEWHQLGLAANVANNLSGLDIACTLCGVIGEDRRGDLFEELLDDHGVKSWGILRTSDRPTTYKERVTTKTQQICRIDYESTESLPSAVESRLIDRTLDMLNDHKAIIIQDYAKGLITENLCTQLIKKFKESKKFVAVDPSRDSAPSFYKGCSLLKPNLVEAKRMVAALGYRESKLEAMANILTEKLQLEKLVITLGGEGMAILDTSGQGKLSIIPTLATEVFDVSGAGDTAISAMMAALVCGANLEEAAWIGNCASGVVVAKKGTAKTNVSELQQFYKMLRLKVDAPHGETI